jgi:hypothetical protein
MSSDFRTVREWETTRSAAAPGFNAETVKWREGDQSKPNPFFILFLNNIALEQPTGSGNFVGDFAQPDAASRRAFGEAAQYAVDNILGRLPGQAEKCLSDSPHVSQIRIWSTFVSGLDVTAATSLVAEDSVPGSAIIAPRRDNVRRFLDFVGMHPDIVFLISRSPTHDRASAFGTTDDDGRPGVRATYDGRTIFHRHFHKIPGMAALHQTSRGMTPVHEFGHAFSSYTNGFITDLYVDGDIQFNRKSGRPIPDGFCAYGGATFLSDKRRDGIGYPAEWRSYHSEVPAPDVPALMDNFWLASGGPMTSRHDRLTKTYILDRIAAKTSR